MLAPLGCPAVELYDHFPDAIHADERYVIYSHGLIVEGNDPKPISPKYGQYDFPAIKQALFSAGGLRSHRLSMFLAFLFQEPKTVLDTRGWYRQRPFIKRIRWR